MDDLTKLINETHRLKERIAKAEAKIKPLKDQEKENLQKIKQLMGKGKVRSQKTNLAHVYLSHNERPIIEDYSKFIAYVKRYNAWDMLPRSLSAKAVKERLEAGKKVSGVSIMESDTVNFRKA